MNQTHGFVRCQYSHGSRSISLADTEVHILSAISLSVSPSTSNEVATHCLRRAGLDHKDNATAFAHKNFIFSILRGALSKSSCFRKSVIQFILFLLWLWRFKMLYNATSLHNRYFILLSNTTLKFYRQMKCIMQFRAKGGPSLREPPQQDDQGTSLTPEWESEDVKTKWDGEKERETEYRSEIWSI